MQKLYVYPHTHWDREWYQPFQTFRLQLIDVVRKILDELDNGNLTEFYLDGQSIILDDVLEIEPELLPRLESHLRSGRLVTGPWYVLADQMLVSGESLVRNLMYGIEETLKYAPPAMVGYCPDTFGHSQDLPSILNGFGIKTACLWRGVPQLEPGPLFFWDGPDGSRVLTYHLARGYYQTSFHELSLQNLSELSNNLLKWLPADERSNGHRLKNTKPADTCLMPAGGDHIGPPPAFNQVLSQLNQGYKTAGAKIKIISSSLSSFMEQIESNLTASKSGKEEASLRIIRGELRSNASASLYERAYLLPGVLSTRLYLKRANRLAEHRLGSLCQPVHALLTALTNNDYPENQLHYAWKLLLKNQPHDSICGCSVDEVHQEMVSRYSQLNDAIEGLFGKVQVQLGNADTTNNELVVFNTSLSPVSMPVYMRWFTDLSDKANYPSHLVQVERKGRVDQLFSGWGTVPYYKEVQECEGWVWVDQANALGTTKSSWPPSGSSDSKVAVCTGGNRKISNGLLSITISPQGKLMVSHAVPSGKARNYELDHTFKDVGDGGDSYNFDPIPSDKPILAKFISTKAGRSGPLVSSLYLTYEIEIPAQAVPDKRLFSTKHKDLGKIELLMRSAEKVRHKITTEVILKRGVPLVFFETKFDNLSRDHRLEVVFDSGAAVKTTYSENHFSTVERMHTTSKQQELPVPLAHEATPDRFPCQRFFIANGQLFLNCGLPEYGVDGHHVSMSLLRAMSFLSRPQLWTRGGGAGPNVPVPESNCIGLQECSYGWAPLSDDKDRSAPTLDDKMVTRAYELSDLFEGRLWTTTANNSDLPTGSLVTLDNPSIRTMSCYLKTNEVRGKGQVSRQRHMVLHLLNVTGTAQKAQINLPLNSSASVQECTISGAVVKKMRKTSGVYQLDFGSHQLIALQITLNG